MTRLNAHLHFKEKCVTTTDHEEFLKQLDGLKAATEKESEKNDIPEDLVAGLDAAINQIKWTPNSSKHIIILGDAPAVDGKDEISEEERENSVGKSLDAILKEARPSGGSDSQRALNARNLHTISNGAEPVIDQILKTIDAEDRKKTVRDLFENKEVIDLALNSPEELVGTFISLGMPQEAAIGITEAILFNHVINRYQKVTDAQFEMISQNQNELDGFFATVNTWKNPGDREKAIDGLTQTLFKSYQVLAAARDGKMTSEGEITGKEGSVSRSIYQIVGTKGDAGNLDQVERGFASVRDGNGRLVGQKKVMIFKEELTRLYSFLDSLHTTFSNKSNKTERQNVNDILQDLKLAVASSAAGENLSEEVNLENILKLDFPLKTPALEINAKQIAVMTTPAFNNWLDSLATARDRAKTLVQGGRQRGLN
ncbi:MAG: hypothetical protein R3C11_00380 [Planctomycetaceae bacterium]